MPDGNDVFNSIQMDIQYEGCINEARAYLDAGEYDKAISAAERARGFLRSGKSPSEIDAIISSARATVVQAEKDARELAEREAQAKRAAAEQERLARQQAEQARREAERRSKEDKEYNDRILKRIVKIAIWIIVIIVIWNLLFG